MESQQTTRRRLLAGVSTGLTLAIAGCGEDSPGSTETGVQDSDGDGVIDSEDYAPRDPAVQSESDTRPSDNSDTATEKSDPGQDSSSETTFDPEDVTYPTHSGSHTITARDNFWAWEFSVGAEFSLDYRAINMRDENYDFDVLLYPPSEFKEYRAIANEVEEGIRPQYLDGSAPGVESGVEVTGVQLPAGKYYLVIDNTDLSDAGDWGTEDTRRVKLDATTRSA